MPKGNQRRRVLAALASAILPGIGQWLLGKKRLAVGFIVAFVMLMLSYWPARLPKYPEGLFCLLLGTYALCILSVWNALRTSSHLASKGSWWWLCLLLPVAVLAISLHSNRLFIAAGFRLYTIPSTGMEPTIWKDDRIIADLWRYRSARPLPPEIVIFNKDGTPLIKRLMAASGHTISGRNGIVFLDDAPLEEPYVQHVGNALPQANNFGPVRIPPGKLFVMGDNRDLSYDSRMPEFGLIGEEQVIGQALYVVRSSDWASNGTDLR